MARYPVRWVPGHPLRYRADGGVMSLTAGHPGLQLGSSRLSARVIRLTAAGGQGSGSISTSGFMARIGPGRALTTGQPPSAARKACAELVDACAGRAPAR